MGLTGGAVQFVEDEWFDPLHSGVGGQTSTWQHGGQLQRHRVRDADEIGHIRHRNVVRISANIIIIIIIIISTTEGHAATTLLPY